MFRRYPYWGWLLLSLALWCLNGFYFLRHKEQLTPTHMARTVNEDIKTREKICASFLADADLVRHIFTDSLTEAQMTKVTALPFYVYGFSSDSLVYWNTNSVIPDPCDTPVNKWIVLRNDKGVFLERCINMSVGGRDKQLVILLPVFISYSINNDYLKSHFVASANIPATVGIDMGAGTAIGKYPVTTLDGSTAFYLHFHADDYEKWSPDLFFIILLIAAVLASISWVHLIIIHLARNRSSLVGFLITLSVIVAFRIALYVFGLPFNLDTLLFFSPQLYASSKYLSSFGDLCINTLCFLWLTIFISRHTPYKHYFDKIKNRKVATGLSFPVAVVMIAYLFLFVSVIRSLVLDSNISFDVSNYSSIDTYTVFGLLVVGIITGLSCMVIYLLNTQLKALLPNRWGRYALVVVVGIAYVLLTGRGNDGFSWAIFVWLLLFIVILDYANFALVSDLFEPRMIFWALFICLFCTSILHYFNNIKEDASRVAYVTQKLSPQRDNEMEYAFDKAATKSDMEILLKGFFKYPSLAGRKMINQRFDTVFFNGPVSKYNSSIYLYDANGMPLYNKDTTGLANWQDQKNESIPTNSPNLFYKESILGDHYYLAYMPVYGDSINEAVGYVVINLDRKKQARVAVYPELLQPAAAKSQLAGTNDYAHAIYINDKLISQNNDYPFTTYLKSDSLPEGQFAFINNKGVSELHFRVSDKRTIVVVHKHNELLDFGALFSYVFVTLVSLALIIIFYQVYLSYFAKAGSTGKLFKLTLRKRVHMAMLVVVLVSFIFIGAATVYFFTAQFRKTNEEKLQTALETAKEAVQEDLKKVNAYDAIYLFDSFSRSVNFKNALTELAKNQKIDINIYDDDGYLFATSQDDIYEKGVLSRMMRPDALYQLSVAGKSKLTQTEHVGNLAYSSAYEPLRNEQGQTLGYINVPFFASEKDLNSQITGVIVTFINLYAFIFLISSLISVGVTRWITQSFNLIIQQFGRLNLQQNERIVWEYDDEIGLLVNEYNKMVNKVEENAALLAQSERESAWREMARQVAHEIKNPLTPMKLNIQYLQQAMRNDAPNIKELTGRVSATIIEQIDNLSYIASEFSNFAKMPEAKPQELDLNELINRAVELYRNEQHIELTITTPPETLYVYSDKSQLLRVCNNLLENARHAIEECENGRIEVSLATDNSNALLAIKDNGHGIPHDVAKKLFQPYFTTKTSGTGLGLAMTRKIIEFWKGEIWFDTEEGKGTTFYIRLPLIGQADADNSKAAGQ
jgi:signal transduction histidine kinase